MVLYELFSLNDGEIRTTQLMSESEARQKNIQLRLSDSDWRWVRCDQGCYDEREDNHTN